MVSYDGMDHFSVTCPLDQQAPQSISVYRYAVNT
jgi:hypothetical protein